MITEKIDVYTIGSSTPSARPGVGDQATALFKHRKCRRDSANSRELNSVVWGT